MAQAITTFLMFEGVAERAMRFYVPLLGRLEIRAVERYGPGETGPEGRVTYAVRPLRRVAAAHLPA